MVPKPISSGRADDRLSLAFNALAAPTRRAILHRLLKGQASAGELAEPFDMSTRAISKHIAVLAQACLVTRAREAQRRPGRLHAQPLVETHGGLEVYLCL